MFHDAQFDERINIFALHIVKLLLYDGAVKVSCVQLSE